MNKIKEFIKKIFNLLIPKHKNRIYVKERLTYLKSNCDLLNYSGSNMYTFLHEYIRKKQQKLLIFYIEYSNIDRKDKYQQFFNIIKGNNIKLIFLYKNQTRINKIKNEIKKFSCKTWLCESGDNFINNGKLRNQNVICFNYFISCKNDLIIGQNFKWKYLKGLITTSLMAGQVCSSSMGVKLDNCTICGFPRNDALLKSTKREEIFNWIKKKIGYIPKHIILYAPTYRDYQIKNKNDVLFYQQDSQTKDENDIDNNISLLDCCENGLATFLEESNSIFIYNLHHFETFKTQQEKNRLIAYEENYDFTLYDLMAITDCLISDYSSIAYDFLLLDRPIIFNLYDKEKYIRYRGVSYDPYEEFCPGAIVKNWDEMKKALMDVVEGKDSYKEHRDRVRKLLHKYPDGNSTERVIAYFDKYIKDLMG